MKDCGPAMELAKIYGLDWKNMTDAQKSATVRLYEFNQYLNETQARDTAARVFIEYVGMALSFGGGFEDLFPEENFAEPLELLPYGTGRGHHPCC